MQIPHKHKLSPKLDPEELERVRLLLEYANLSNQLLIFNDSIIICDLARASCRCF
jgi:hypothetical protein